MDTRACLKASFLLPLNILLMLLYKVSLISIPRPTLSTIFSPFHRENITIENPPQLSVPPLPPQLNMQDNINVEWIKLIIAFCFACATEMAIQPTQTRLQPPLLFHILSLVISLTFASLFVAKFIGSKFPIAAQVLERVALFFAATGFFLAVSIPFPVYINCATWAVYVVSLVAIFVCHYCVPE